MLTIRQNLLETIHGGNPDRFVNQYEFLKMIGNTPLNKHNPATVRGGPPVKNLWGVTMSWPAHVPGQFPVHDYEHRVVKDITKWRDTVKAPSVDFPEEEWADAIAAAEAIDRSEYFVTAMVAPGVFEQVHYLLSIEEALVMYAEEPEAMHELVDAVAEYRFQYAKLLVDNLKPDVILSHDDWGSKRSLFMQPDTWREFFKDHYKRIYGYMKDHGVIVIHHADSFCEPIVEDMVDIGIDVWQGVLPENDIVKLQKQLDGRMTLMGGIDATIDRKDSTEEEIRADVRRACSTYGPGGHYIPCMTYGLAGTIYPRTDEVIADEIDRYNKETYGV